MITIIFTRKLITQSNTNGNLYLYIHGVSKVVVRGHYHFSPFYKFVFFLFRRTETLNGINVLGTFSFRYEYNIGVNNVASLRAKYDEPTKRNVNGTVLGYMELLRTCSISYNRGSRVSVLFRIFGLKRYTCHRGENCGRDLPRASETERGPLRGGLLNTIRRLATEIRHARGTHERFANEKLKFLQSSIHRRESASNESVRFSRRKRAQTPHGLDRF